MNVAADRSRERLGKRAALLGGFAAALALYTTHATMPRNTFELPFEHDLQVLAWAPESFKFFTRDPQEPRALVFVRDGGAFRSVDVPGGSPRFLFGLDRRGRTAGSEIAMLLEGFTKSTFRDCEDEPATCLERQDRVIKLDNRAPNPQLCGQVGIAMQKPVPWVWAKSGRPVTMPSRVVRLEVAC